MSSLQGEGDGSLEPVAARSSSAGTLDRTTHRSLSTTRTTGLADRRCARCDSAIRGRRRNGFCSDACRMAATRERNAARRKGLLADLRRVVDAVERELLPDTIDGAGDDRGVG